MNAEAEHHDSSASPLLQEEQAESTACPLISPVSKSVQHQSNLARIRIYWFAFVLCCGALLFGYDSGLIGELILF